MIVILLGKAFPCFKLPCYVMKRSSDSVVMTSHPQTNEPLLALAAPRQSMYASKQRKILISGNESYMYAKNGLLIPN